MTDHHSALSRTLANADGSMAVLFALFFMVAMSICALAIDMGSLYLERRTAQGAADLAAIAAASDLDHADAAARATLAANGFGDLRTLSLVKGRYVVDPDVLPDARFEAGKLPYNAVRLDAALGGQLYFAKSFMADPEISVSAIGTADAQATFSIGSRLASVNGGVLNSLLKSLLGGNVSLTAMDYNALLGANISLDGFLSALATQMGVTAGTYSDVLDAQVSAGNVLKAAAKAATTGGQSQAAQALTSLAGQISTSTTVPVGKLVDLGPLAYSEIGQPHAGLDAGLNLMSLVSAMAQAVRHAGHR